MQYSEWTLKTKAMQWNEWVHEMHFSNMSLTPRWKTSPQRSENPESFPNQITHKLSYYTKRDVMSQWEWDHRSRAAVLCIRSVLLVYGLKIWCTDPFLNEASCGRSISVCDVCAVIKRADMHSEHESWAYWAPGSEEECRVDGDDTETLH